MFQFTESLFFMQLLIYKQALVKVGLGVVLLPIPKWADYTDDSIVLLHIEKPVCKRTIALSYLHGRYLSKSAYKFKNYTIDYFQK
jgi:LysR family transcriptional regulator, transcription activator of glutamate synthase operon